MTIKGCHVMAKPSGSACNLGCDYCFYLEKEKLYPERQVNWKMSDETLNQFIQQHIDAQAGMDVEFAWQGGEPTLLGIEFFERVIELCEKHRGQKQIHHSFQTNGVLINDKWCELFKKHGFLIGISIDGPEDLHDHYRLTRSRKGTYNKVMDAVELLKKHQIDFNTLTVVNDKNVKHPLRVYEFLKSIGSGFIQFIPLLERKHSESQELILSAPSEPYGKVTQWSVSPVEYGDFLNSIFDYWVRNDVGKTFVQTFDSTLATWINGTSSVCVFSKSCGHAFALEANGDLYQCDHYVYPKYKLGNIHHQTIHDMNNSEMAIEFGLSKSTTLNGECKRCRYLPLCNGGCPKHRFSTSFSGKPNHNYLCTGYFKYFEHTENAMKIMRMLVLSKKPAFLVNRYL
ncbi:anaerobic sulfatase maturase [Vibrio mediterranei]|jgi:uncharacterized protein|uniref:anaerobic sulfatase maturase n=1 Tax=Vibrio mediterranei TaxID=689 RepID=UPI002283570E|nr:anaerobic sulfatase maturase [Vibrio mediterranei]MCY9855085.1 anaerobic sulfatase maturase [Vibrio mediterranei]